MDEKRIYASYVNNTDVNGYISELIHEDKQIHGDKPKNKKRNKNSNSSLRRKSIDNNFTDPGHTV